MGSEDKLRPDFPYSNSGTTYEVLIHDNDELVADLLEQILVDLDKSGIENFYEDDVINTKKAEDLDEAAEMLEEDEYSPDIFITGLKGDYNNGEPVKDERPLFQGYRFDNDKGLLEVDEEDKDIEYTGLEFIEDYSNKLDGVCTVLTQVDPNNRDLDLTEYTGIDSYRQKSDVIRRESFKDWTSYMITLADYSKSKRDVDARTPCEIAKTAAKLDQVANSGSEKASSWHVI